jgi:hypothetical protein
MKPTESANEHEIHYTWLKNAGCMYQKTKGCNECLTMDKHTAHINGLDHKVKVNSEQTDCLISQRNKQTMKNILLVA